MRLVANRNRANNLIVTAKPFGAVSSDFGFQSVVMKKPQACFVGSNVTQLHDASDRGDPLHIN